ncbi:MAG: GtrA family protein [Crocosphaera sp.]|nr:GtrA family protein [Crocosphaera sp.]
MKKVKIQDSPKRCLDTPKFQLVMSWFSIDSFIRFALVGLSGIIVDLGVFAILQSLLSLPLIVSAIFSTEVAIINNFFGNDRWTFRDIYQEQQAITQQLRRFVKFNLICCLGLILNSLIVYWLVDQFAVNKYIAKMVAILCVTFFNFWLNIKLNWQTK